VCNQRDSQAVDQLGPQAPISAWKRAAHHVTVAIAWALASVFLVNVMRSAAMVAYAWDAIDLSGNPGSAGWIFLAGALTAVLAGPLGGMVADRIGFRNGILSGEMLAALAVGLYGTIHVSTGTPKTIVPLVLAAVIVSLGGTLTFPALNSMLQLISPVGGAFRIASYNALASGVAYVVGSVASGLVIDWASADASFLMCGAVSIAAACVAGRVRALTSARPGAGKGTPAQPGKRGMWDVIMMLGAHKRTRSMVLGFITIFAIFNTLNVFLPSFARYGLLANATEVGVLRAAWSAGAIFGALGLSVFPFGFAIKPYVLTTWMIAMGAAMMALAECGTYVIGAALLAIAGVSFTIVRSILDGFVIMLIDEDKVGRVRGFILSLTNLVGAVCFFGVAQLTESQLSMPFLLVGSVAVLSAFLIVDVTKEDD
jgi:MFS family permease